MNTSYVSSVKIHYYQLELNNYADYMERIIENMKRKGAIEVFDAIYSSGCPVVVETHLESWDDPYELCREYRLHYRLTAVQTNNIVLPVFEFVNHSGEIEWKCASCGTINKIDASYCGELHVHAIGCGSPRERTRQEMESSYVS